MKEHQTKFVQTLKKFITELNSISSTIDTKNVLAVYEKLNMKRVMKRYLDIMELYQTNIMEEDENMFEDDIMILPKVNIKYFWSKADDLQRKRFWVYLKMLFILSEICIKGENSDMGDEIQNKQKSDEFNPYVGVGCDTSKDEYNVNQMYSGVEKQSPQEDTSISSMASMLGVDLDKLSEELKDMGDSDIDEATNNIMGMLGSNVDDRTSGAITEMLNNISSELKTADMSKNNLFDSIAGIAKSVAGKMKPKVESGELDIKNLWTSTQNITSTYMGDQGVDGDMNPMNAINNVMENMTNDIEEKQQEENKQNNVEVGEVGEVGEVSEVGEVGEVGEDVVNSSHN